jgi:hypothetical protein
MIIFGQRDLLIIVILILILAAMFILNYLNF